MTRIWRTMLPRTMRLTSQLRESGGYCSIDTC